MVVKLICADAKVLSGDLHERLSAHSNGHTFYELLNFMAFAFVYMSMVEVGGAHDKVISITLVFDERFAATASCIDVPVELHCYLEKLFADP